MGTYLPVGSNVERAARAAVRRIVYSSEEEEAIPIEYSRKNVKWRDMEPKVYKYVDDNLLVNRVNMETAAVGRDADACVDGPGAYWDKHGIECQNGFRRVVRRAEEKGMKVNGAKTLMLCISGATS